SRTWIRRSPGRSDRGGRPVSPAPGGPGQPGAGQGAPNKVAGFSAAFGRGQVGGDLGELIEGSLQVFDDLGRGNSGVREVVGIAETVVAQPEDIEVGFVALDQVFVGEGSEALGFGPLVAVIRVVGADEIVQVATGEGVGLQGEVLVGAEIVDPQGACPGSLAGRLAVEEEHVGLDALGVEDAGGQAEQGMDIAIVEEALADGFAGAALKQDVVGQDDGGASVDLEQAADVLEEVELLVAGGG